MSDFRAFMYGTALGYVGSPNIATDYRCAALHGTTRIRVQRTKSGLHVYTATGLHPTYQDNFQMALLIPDRGRTNQEDFIWCIPIDRSKWNKWYELAKQFQTVTPEQQGSVRYMTRLEGREAKTIMMLPTEEQDDEAVTVACAFLRLVQGITCRMYVVRSTDDVLTGARLMHQVAGVDPKLVEEISDDEEARAAEKT